MRQGGRSSPGARARARQGDAAGQRADVTRESIAFRLESARAGGARSFRRRRGLAADNRRPRRLGRKSLRPFRSPSRSPSPFPSVRPRSSSRSCEEAWARTILPAVEERGGIPTASLLREAHSGGPERRHAARSSSRRAPSFTSTLPATRRNADATRRRPLRRHGPQTRARLSSSARRARCPWSTRSRPARKTGRPALHRGVRRDANGES